MSIYHYLLNKEINMHPYPQDASTWTKTCVWVLRNLYGARYWHDVCLKQIDIFQEYKRKIKENKGV